MIDTVEVQDKGLRPGVLSMVSSLVIGVAATAPAYSMAATLGLLVASGAGVHAPAFILLAFVPMLLVAVAFRELNRVQPDCGTTFTWAARAFGPSMGMFTGWVVIVAQILVMTSQSALTGRYTFLLLGWHELADDPVAVTVLGVVWLVVLSWLCYRGIEISAKVQWVLLVVEVTVLVVFAVVALARVADGTAGASALTPQWNWLSPGGIGFGGFGSAMLLSVFIYWGFESSLSVNEESADPERAPGRAAVLSTALLLVTYLLVTVAAVAFAGVGTKGNGLANPDNAGDVLAGLGRSVFGAGGFGHVFGLLLVVSVLTSGAATSQATIMPVARTTLAMSSHGALPPIFARVHRRYRTPTVGTWSFCVVSVLVYVALSVWSSDVLADSVEATGIMIAVEYGLITLGCVLVFRRSLTASVRNFLLRGVFPGIGALFFFGVLVFAFWEYGKPDHGETTVFGLGGVAAVGVICLLVGVPLVLVLRRICPRFFSRAGRESPGTPGRG